MFFTSLGGCFGWGWGWGWGEWFNRKDSMVRTSLAYKVNLEFKVFRVRAFFFFGLGGGYG